MSGAAELEIGLHRRDAETHSVELRFAPAGSEADVRVAPAGAGMTIDFAELRSSAHDAEARGRLLGEALFADPELARGLAQARASADAADVPLRLRLSIGPSAPELHAVHWETLIPPGEASAIATSERVLLSRYLSSADWRPVKLRPQSEMSGLVVIANPAGLERYAPGNVALAPVDVEGELARARAGLAGMPLTELASGGSATLDALQAGLREGPDLLYLACHGALVDGEPWLWLEDEEGTVALTEGRELVTRLAELPRMPRLVVLASCQSAGAGQAGRATDSGALSALGPRLAEAGVAAVVGMQGNITMETVSELMPAFFEQLARHGEVDRAMAVARGRVRDRPDWWMPALFMRLKSGRIAYAPGFGESSDGLRKWPALINNVKRGRCTPILGAGLTENLWGTRADIARTWAERHGFPMDRAGRDQLPRVAQFLAVDQDPAFPSDELERTLREELVRRHAGRLGGANGAAPLGELLRALSAARGPTGPLEPHAVLASLPLPIYLTTQPDDLLGDALRAAGKEPVVELCKWNEELEMLPSIQDEEPGFRPSPERPLVYHLFGRLDEPGSLVLTEDDHFEFLAGTTRNEELIPAFVRRALADTALLLLGFQLDDWDFRVLFRSLIGQEGRRRRSRYAHVAAQVDPEQGRAEEPQRAQSYLEERLEHSDFSIYWGGVDDFLAELAARVAKEGDR